MKVLCCILLTLGLMESCGSSPVFSRKALDPWTKTSYRERLQSWGLYPKVFRYGTTNHHHAVVMPKKKEIHWAKRLAREYEGQDMIRMAANEIDKPNRYDQQFEKFKEKLFQKMEQDALEIVWQHR